MCGRYAFDDIKEIYEARKILEEISSRLGGDASDTVKSGEVFRFYSNYRNGFGQASCSLAAMR